MEGFIYLKLNIRVEKIVIFLFWRMKIKEKYFTMT